MLHFGCIQRTADVPYRMHETGPDNCRVWIGGFSVL